MPMTLQAAGALRIAGNVAAAALDALDAEMRGILHVNLPPGGIYIVSNATLGISGVVEMHPATPQFGGVSLTTVVSDEREGEVDATLGGVTLVSGGEAAPVAPVEHLSLTSVAKLLNEGDISVSLGALAVDGQVRLGEWHSGEVLGTLGGATLSSTLEGLPSGQVDKTLGALTLSSVGTVSTRSGSLVRTLSTPTLIAPSKLALRGQTARTLSMVRSSAQGQLSGGGPSGPFVIGLKTESDQRHIIEEFEAWLGRETGCYTQFLDGSNGTWEALAGSAGYAANLRWYAERGGIVEYSIPYFPDPWDSAQHEGYDLVISGARDWVFREQARGIDDNTPTGHPVRLRPAWEFNGLFPWDVMRDTNFTENEEFGGQGAYRAAWRRIHMCYHTERPNRDWQWAFCPGNFGHSADYDWMRVWPGDDVVDIHSIDFYFDFVPFVDGRDKIHGFAYQLEQAQIHGKALACSEFGFDSLREGSIIGPEDVRGWAEWLRDNQYLYANQWEENSPPFVGKLRNGPGSDGAQPEIGPEFKAAFGPGGYAYT